MALPTTDPIPRTAAGRRVWNQSDALRSIALPPAEDFQHHTGELERLMALARDREARHAVEGACQRLVASLARFYGVFSPPVKLLGQRPRRVYGGIVISELHGDYHPRTARIRVWLRTAVRGQIVAYRTLLDTLLHEFSHHLDYARLGFPGSPHTRGFFERVRMLYLLALGRKMEPPIWDRLRNGRYVMNLQAMKAREAVARG